MNNFVFCSPTEFVFGRGTEKEVGRLAAKYGAKKVLIHYGGGSVIKSGLLERVKASLSESGLSYLLLGGVQPNPRSGLVYEGIEFCRAEKVDFILAVGGGSVIDSAKMIAAGVCYDGDFWDFHMGKEIEMALPVGTVLTIPAAGSEGSPNAVITNEKNGLKRGTKGEAIRPRFSILNPELTATLPSYQCACGAADIMAHVLERYFTNTHEVEVTDRLCEALLITMINEAPRIVKNPADYDAQANVMWAGMLAHNNVCGVGREQDWATHGMSHGISARYDAAHGATLATMFPAWMKYNISHGAKRLGQLATRVWGIDAAGKSEERLANECIQKFKEFWRSLGLPSSFAELGAKEADIPALVEELGLTDGKTHGFFVKLTAKDVEEIYKIAARG